MDAPPTLSGCAPFMAEEDMLEVCKFYLADLRDIGSSHYRGKTTTMGGSLTKAGADAALSSRSGAGKFK